VTTPIRSECRKEYQTHETTTVSFKIYSSESRSLPSLKGLQCIRTVVRGSLITHLGHFNALPDAHAVYTLPLLPLCVHQADLNLL
jgi:hypothetical protein